MMRPFPVALLALFPAQTFFLPDLIAPPTDDTDDKVMAAVMLFRPQSWQK